MPFKVDSLGLRQWSIPGREMLHPDAHFALSELYTRHFPAFAATLNPGSFVGSYVGNPGAVDVQYEAATMRQTWKPSSKGSLYGSISVSPSYTGNIRVWGLSRLHVELAGITEVYPRVSAGDLRQNLGVFFPSHGTRIGGRAWIKAKSGEFHVALRGECATKRHLLYWEKYSETRYALHVIFAWPLDEEDVEVELELSATPMPLTPLPSTSAQSHGRPVIHCVRAMAERITRDNPHGYTDIRLDDAQQARAYIRPLANRGNRIGALGIIGWPWGFTDDFGKTAQGHSYPFNSFAVPPALHQCLSVMRDEWTLSGKRFGGLYRPTYHTTNGNRSVRYCDRTAQRSIINDFRDFHPSLLYMDDCGVDAFPDDITAPDVSEFVGNLKWMREQFGPEPIWYVEHPSTATLPYAGGYVTLEKHPDGKLRPNLGELQWRMLREVFPGASWLVAPGPKLWGQPWDVQRDVIEWASAQGGNVSPLIQDWLLTEELTTALAAMVPR